MEFDPLEMQSVRSNIQNFEDDVERDKYVYGSMLERAAEAEKEATQQRETDQQIYSNLESGQLDPVQQEQQGQQEQEKQQFDANANVPVDILRAFPNAAVNISEDILNFGTADDPRFTLDTIEPQMKTPWGQMTSGIVQSVGPLLAIAALTPRGRSLIRTAKFAGRVAPGGFLDKLGTGSAVLGAIPVVGEVAGIGVGLYEGIKGLVDLFEKKKGKPPTPKELTGVPQTDLQTQNTALTAKLTSGIPTATNDISFDSSGIMSF